MNPLENEPEILHEVDKLLSLLLAQDDIQAFRQIQQRTKENKQLQRLEEAIKQAQKDAVLFGHYQKPEAQKEALAKADALTKEFNDRPIVAAYRERLNRADEILQYVSKEIQRQVNEAIEEETKNASKNEKYTNDGTISKH